MPVSMEFLRGILGVIAIGCAYMAGRAAALTRQGRHKQSYIYGWVFRTLACFGGVAYRNPVDEADIAIGSLAIAAFAAAWWNQSRAKKTEEPPIRIFTDET